MISSLGFRKAQTSRHGLLFEEDVNDACEAVSKDMDCSSEPNIRMCNGVVIACLDNHYSSRCSETGRGLERITPNWLVPIKDRRRVLPLRAVKLNGPSGVVP